MEALYHVEYSHPNGDFYSSPETNLNEFGTRITEQQFIDIMKENFETRQSVRESNIQIIKTVGTVQTVIYEQKRF